MEVSLYHINTRNLCSILPLRKIKHHAETGLSFKVVGKWKWGLNHEHVHGLAVKCSGPLAEIEREVEAEMNPEKEEWIKHKCGERKGVVELLECLEHEAIMGDDQGREPNDYNRRAQIFDKSSRVFQVLKEKRDLT